MSPTGWLLLVLVVAAVLAAVTLRDRFANPKRRISPDRKPQSRQETLRDLGISEARPANSSSTGEADDEGAPVPSTEIHPKKTAPVTPPVAMPPEESTATTVDPALPEEPKARPARVRVRDNASLWRSREDAAARLLDSLAVLCSGRTALFLVNDDEQSVDVVAVAGGSRLELRTRPLAECEIVGQVGEKIVSVPASKRDALFYHPAPEVGIAEAKIIRVTEAPHLVLAVDVPAGGRIDSELTGLIGHYANVLKGMLAVDPELVFGPGPHDQAETGAEEADEKEKSPSLPDLFSQIDDRSGEAGPTRLQLLADELAIAREESKPLAFALVAPRRADELLETHADDIRGLEQEIAERLLSVDGTRRVEPFGDLLLGVFGDLQGSEFDAWAEAVAVETPVHIGAVIVDPNGEVDAEAVRDEAANAVHAAYEKGQACVVVTPE